MEKVFAIIGVFVIVIGLAIGLAILFAFPVMWLWNYVMPDIFGLTTITLKQALALSLLTGILFPRSMTPSKK